MKEQCKTCLYFSDEPMLIGTHCRHFNTSIIPGWGESQADGKCNEYTNKEKWIQNVTELLRERGLKI